MYFINIYSNPQYYSMLKFPIRTGAPNSGGGVAGGQPGFDKGGLQ